MAFLKKNNNNTIENNEVVDAQIIETHKNSLIGKTIFIKGVVKADEEIIIEGKIDGSVKVGNKVIVGEKGDLKADIEANEVVIKGKVKGNINGSKRVEIIPGGYLKGNITSPKVVIADGAVFKGNISMGDNDEDDEASS